MNLYLVVTQTTEQTFVERVSNELMLAKAIGGPATRWSEVDNTLGQADEDMLVRLAADLVEKFQLAPSGLLLILEHRIADGVVEYIVKATDVRAVR